MQRFTARAVVVGDRAGTVIPDAVLEVDDGRIGWVGPAAEAPPADDAEVVELPGVLLPGLVNTHSHAPMVLFRGQGEGLPLDRWLQEVMWPREARLTARGRRGRDDRRLGGDAGQRRDHQRRDVLPPGTNRRRGRPDRRARASSRPRCCRCPACRRSSEQLQAAVELAAGAPGDGDGRVRASARTPPTRCRCRCCGRRRDRGRASTDCCCTCTSPRPRPRAPTCSAEHGLSVPPCWPRTTCSAAGCSPRTACTWTTATSSCGRSTTSPSPTARPATPSWPAASRRCAHARPRHPGRHGHRRAGVQRRAGPVRRPAARGVAGPAGRPLGDRATAAEAFWLATGAAADAIGRPDLGQLEAGRRADLVHVDTRNLVFEPVGDPGRRAGAPGVVRRGPARARRLGRAGGRWCADGASTSGGRRRAAADVAARAARLAAG